MAAVMGLNGQAETFASVDSTSSNDDRQSGVSLRVNKVMTCSKYYDRTKTCPLTEIELSKDVADATPDPGYVIKTSANGSRMKVFINVCKTENIGKPLSTKQIARGGRSGLSWTVPHTLTERVSRGSCHNQTYRVFDFQVHPDACRMAEANRRFKSMLDELAVGTVAGEFSIHVNARKLQFPKIKYKELPVISSKKEVAVSLPTSGSMAHVQEEMKASFQQEIKDLTVDSGKLEMVDHDAKQESVLDTKADFDANNNKFITPKYTVVLSVNEEIPVINGVSYSQMLIVDIELPLLKSALEVNLDVFEKRLNLVSTNCEQYQLQVDLPCVVDENHSFAKFIRSRKVLHIAMPVLTPSSMNASSLESTAETNYDEKWALQHAGNETNTECYESSVPEHSTGFVASSIATAEVAYDHKGDSILSDEDDLTVSEHANTCTTVDNGSNLIELSCGQDFQVVNSQAVDIKAEVCTSTGLKDLNIENTAHLETESEDKTACTEVQISYNKDAAAVEKLTKNGQNASSEILVVHKKGVPKLHGILKQRTVSESSDDVLLASSFSGCDRQASTTTGSEGDDAEDGSDWSSVSIGSSGRILKKSVSFSDHIDHTLFQANQSVSSMHAALKNRRRRARKRDQKQEQRGQRRRHRSSGSFSLEESGDERAVVTQSVHVPAGKGDDCVPSSTGYGERLNNLCCSSSVDANVDDGFDSNCGAATTTNEEVFSFEDFPDRESSNGNGCLCENEKAALGTSQKAEVGAHKMQSENIDCVGAVRTKTDVVHEDCECVGSNDVSEISIGIGDASLFCHCPAGGSSVASENITGVIRNSAASCAHDSAEAVTNASKTDDATASGPEPQTHLSENISSCWFDLDVD